MQTSVRINITMKEVTIIYYGEGSLEVKYGVDEFPLLESGRVVIPESYKKNKSIIAVCEGRVEILNKFGDRIEFQDMHNQTFQMIE